MQIHAKGVCIGAAPVTRSTLSANAPLIPCRSCAAQILSAKRPSGRSTRRIASRAPSLSGKNCNPCWIVTRLNVPFSKRSVSATPTCQAISNPSSRDRSDSDLDHCRIHVEAGDERGAGAPGSFAGHDARSAGDVEQVCVRGEVEAIDQLLRPGSRPEWNHERFVGMGG